MPELVWRAEPPTLDEVRAAGAKFGCEAYYWVRGWNFNRPVMACAIIGGRRQPNGAMGPELRFQVPASRNLSDGVWARDFESGHVPEDGDSEKIKSLKRLMRNGTWRPLEWAGPVPSPTENPEPETHR